MEKFLCSGIFCFGDQWWLSLSCLHWALAEGRGREWVRWLCKAVLAQWSLESSETGSQAASSALSCWAGSQALSWALFLCWVCSITGLPSAGSLSQGTRAHGRCRAGHSFHFKHISVKWGKSAAPHLAVFSHATILFQMKYDNTTVAVITVIDFREFKMIM